MSDRKRTSRGGLHRIAWGSLVLALVAAAPLACSDDAPEGLPKEGSMFASGSRLQAITFELDGGVSVLDRWHDTKLDLDCSFDGLIGPSGRDACLPLSTFTVANRYANAGCSARLIQRYGHTVDPPAMVTIPTRNSCGVEPEVVEVGGHPKALYVDDPTTGCRVADGDVGDYFLVGDTVDPKTFVGAKPVPESAGARLGALALVGDDGARQVIAGWDQKNDEAIEGKPAIAGREAMWVPWGLAWVSSGPTDYLDPQCTQPLAFTIDYRGHCPITAVETDAGFSAIGAKVDTTQGIYQQEAAGAECTPLTFSPGLDLGQSFYEIGKPMVAFPDAKLVEVGTGRIHSLVWATPQGTGIYPSGQLLDTQREEPCEIAVASDGTRRCLPGRVIEETYFTDAACTDEVVIISLYETNGVAPKTYRKRVRIDNDVDLDSVHELGPQLPGGPLFYKDINDTCADASEFTDSDSAHLYARGPVIAPEAFEATLGQ